MRRIGSDTEKLEQNVLLWGAVIAGGYFLVLKPILAGIGIDPVSAATIAAQQAVPPTSNPFNYQFQPFVDFYNNNPPTIIGSSSNLWQGFLFDLNLDSGSTVPNSSPTMQQFFFALKQNPGSVSPWGSLDTIALSTLAEQINSAINGFTLVATDQNAAMSPLAQITNQMQLAFIANYFWWVFSLDLLTDLQGSLTKTGLTPQNLAAFITHVNAMPLSSI